MFRHDFCSRKGMSDAAGRRDIRNTRAWDGPPSESGSHAVAPGRKSCPPRLSAVSQRDTPLLPARPRRIGSVHATLTIMSGMEAGRVIPLEDSTVIGRERSQGLSIEDPGLSRSHAHVGRREDGGFYIEDLESTNGTLVNGRRVVMAAHLEPGDYIQLGGSLLLRFAMIDATDEEMRRQLFESSVHDPLTRVYNRRYFFQRLDAEANSAKRKHDSLALLLIDVDEFKHFNDTFGHMPGDRALCFIAAQVARTLRAGSVLARYGGEEFVVLLPGTPHGDALRLAERVRAEVEGLRFSVAANSVSLTISIGVASLSELAPGEDATALVSLADERLYAAKRAGRNRVEGGDGPG
jgi:diguanylate cyclase (GGDEF)-like protein